MFIPQTGSAWLARVHHDLVKRLLWVARDLRESGAEPKPGELVATLIDEEGQPVDASVLWESLRAAAPKALDVNEFGAAVRACVDAANANDLPGVLQLEQAFERLRAIVASSLNQPGAAEPPTRKAR
jgi:hypothetical protein